MILFTKTSQIKKNKFKVVFKDVHIRLQQRRGKKSLTTIYGLDRKLDFEKITQTLKKFFCCNGCVTCDSNFGIIIQLQGDQRTNVIGFLIKQEIVLSRMIKIHGV